MNYKGRTKILFIDENLYKKLKNNTLKGIERFKIENIAKEWLEEE